MKILDVVLSAKMAAQSAYAENRSTPNRRDHYAFFKELSSVPRLQPSVRKYIVALYENTFAAEIKRFGGV